MDNGPSTDEQQRTIQQEAFLALIDAIEDLADGEGLPFREQLTTFLRQRAQAAPEAWKAEGLQTLADAVHEERLGPPAAEG